MKIAAVIPLYNHKKTIRQVVLGALTWVDLVIVVDDGSTDCPQSLEDLLIHVIHHDHNQGKGVALRSGATLARSLGASHILTLDADGQHLPSDIPLFLEAIKAEPKALIIGARNFAQAHIPLSSRFGRKFSGFWAYLQTGLNIADMQSGFRAYPLELFEVLDLKEQRYSFEVEIVVKAAWAGFMIREIPIQVYYPTAAERISHFSAILDNWRMSLLNTKLTIRALLPVPFRCHALDPEGKVSLLHPIQSLNYLLRTQVKPVQLGFSSMVSVFISTLPLLGLQSLLLLFCIASFNLNRLVVLSLIPLTWPPFVPGLAVLLGYYLRHGKILTEFSVQTLGYEAPQRLLEWIMGSLVLAPILGFTMGLIVWLLASGVKKICSVQL